MKQPRPFIIKASLVLLALRFIIGVAMLGFCYFTLESGLDGEGFFHAMKRLMYEQYGIEGDSQEYMFGLLIGNLLIPGISSLIAMIGIWRRMYALSIVFLAIDFLFIMFKAVPMGPIIVLVLLFLPPSRRYFNLASTRGRVDLRDE